MGQWIVHDNKVVNINPKSICIFPVSFRAFVLWDYVVFDFLSQLPVKCYNSAFINCWLCFCPFVSYWQHTPFYYRKLKNELIKIRGSGVNRRKQQVNERACKRCQNTLGLVFFRGDQCQICKDRVCAECRVVLKDGGWKCTACSKIAYVFNLYASIN